MPATPKARTASEPNRNPMTVFGVGRGKCTVSSVEGRHSAGGYRRLRLRSPLGKPLHMWCQRTKSLRAIRTVFISMLLPQSFDPPSGGSRTMPIPWPHQKFQRKPSSSWTTIRASATRSRGSCARRVECRDLRIRRLRFLARPDRQRSGCLVLDVTLPGLDGLELQRRQSESGRALPVVFLTGRGDIPMSVQAIKAGAVDFLTKPVQSESLFRAVRAALEQDAAARVAQSVTSELHHRFETLTPREREVLAAIAAGRLNKQIAGDLGHRRTNRQVSPRPHHGAYARQDRCRTDAPRGAVGNRWRHADKKHNPDFSPGSGRKAPQP